jgi:hypothetical protein
VWAKAKIIQVIESQGMRWTGKCGTIGRKINAYRVLVGKTD